MDPKKALKIKSGAVRRLCKDVAHYAKEKATHEAKLQSLREAGAEKYDLKKVQEFLGSKFSCFLRSNMSLVYR